MSFLLLLFPDGHLPSPRWRWFGWFTAGFIGLVALGVALDPQPQQLGSLFVNNPLGMVPASASERRLGLTLVASVVLIAALRGLTSGAAAG